MPLMSKAARKPKGSPRERILQVASDLFYHQGYRATGVNEVIEKSGVAKATFYSHFPSKDELALTYLQQVKDAGVQHVEDFIQAGRDPLARYYAVIRSLEPWMLETDFRGCNFINMVAEIPDPGDPLRKVGKEIYDLIRGRVNLLIRDLIAWKPSRYGKLKADELTGEYMVAFTGAIALAGIYHAKWPVVDALNTVRRLIGQTAV